MKFFFDEDTGRGVPDALHSVGIACEYPSKKLQRKAKIGRGTADELWIPYAGKKGLLVFSCNKAILEADTQRELWIENEVGGVFLTTGQERKADVLLLVLRRLMWLEDIHANTRRPFAYTTTIRGNWKRVL